MNEKIDYQTLEIRFQIPRIKISLQIQGYFYFFTLEFSFPGCHFVEDHYKLQLQLQAIAHAHKTKTALLFCHRGHP